MDELLAYVAQVGFPAAIAAYLLVRMEVTLKELTKAIMDLRAVVCKHVGNK